jgi:hypothetical protein
VIRGSSSAAEYTKDLTILRVGQKVSDICGGVGKESAVKAIGSDGLHDGISTRFILLCISRAANVLYKLCSLLEDKSVEHTVIWQAVLYQNRFVLTVLRFRSHGKGRGLLHVTCGNHIRKLAFL